MSNDPFSYKIPRVVKFRDTTWDSGKVGIGNYCLMDAVCLKIQVLRQIVVTVAEKCECS